MSRPVTVMVVDRPCCTNTWYVAPNPVQSSACTGVAEKLEFDTSAADVPGMFRLAT